MSLSTTTSTTIFLSLILNLSFTSAYPTSVSKRSAGLSHGATAGLAIGIAIAGILLVAVAVFLLLQLRSRARGTTPTTRPHGIPSLEKHHSTATTISNDNVSPRPHEEWTTTNGNQTSQPATSVRSQKKSLKDHLMGPMYRDPQNDIPTVPLPVHVRRSPMTKGADSSTSPVERSDAQLEQEFLEAGGVSGQRDTVQSFSSRRATRLMMMM